MTGMSAAKCPIHGCGLLIPHLHPKDDNILIERELRVRFACAALPGLVAVWATDDEPIGPKEAADAASNAWRVADAMIAGMEKKP